MADTIMPVANAKSDIGLIGLAVMGQNLALNIADHGFRTSVFNRTTETMTTFVQKNPDTPGGLVGHKTLKAFIGSLKKPRKIIIMVKAGAGTDAVINRLVPLLDRNDIIIDGGNSKWTDTIRREKDLKQKGLRFIGSGVSGGEEGARIGPSIMPGGSPAAWEHVKPIFQAVSAKVEDGSPCCEWVGENGAGHFVKMTHNGIEYGDMQLICEASWTKVSSSISGHCSRISSTSLSDNSRDRMMRLRPIPCQNLTAA